MKLTREQAIAEHRKMWNWIADETEKRTTKVTETDYFVEHNIATDHLFHNSYCCTYCYMVCELCPIDWGSNAKNYKCDYANIGSGTRGIHSLWKHTSKHKKAAKLARQIAELPERTDNIPVSK